MDSFDIDQTAQRLLRNALPVSWLIRDQNPDFHVDYSIEIREEGEPTGRIFFCQLKGCVNPKYAKKHLSYPLKKKHLRYYLERLKIPVFLVVEDVSTGKGYWLFLQGYLTGLKQKTNLHKGGTLSVKVPLENDIADTVLLNKAVTEAELFMRELHPGTVAAAIEAERDRLRRLDDRFDVDIACNNEVMHYRCRPKAPFECGVEIKNQEGRAKLAEFVSTGRPIRFERSEINFKGSELLDYFQDRFNSGVVEVSSGRKSSCEMLLFTSQTVSGEGRRNTIYIHGATLSGGVDGVHFEGYLGDSPLSISGNALYRGASGSVDIEFLYDKWVGEKALFLSHFDKIYDLYLELIDGAHLELELDLKGNKLFSARLDKDFGRKLIDCFSGLDFIHKLRVVSRFLGIDPNLPTSSELSDEEEENLLQLYEIATRGYLELPAKGASLKTTVHSLDIERFGGTDNRPDRRFIFAENEPSLRIFGCKTDKYLNRVVLTGFSLTERSVPLLLSADFDSGESVELEFVGGEGAIYKRELIPV